MGKILLWIAVIAVVYFAYKLIVVSQRRTERSSRGEAGRGAASGEGEPMRQCAHCGVYLPASDALSARGLHYCSAEHRDAGAKD